MTQTLPGFLIAVGIGLFVFSLFKGSVTFKDTTLPELGKKGRIILMVLGPTLAIVGGIIYFRAGPLVMTPKPKIDGNETTKFPSTEIDKRTVGEVLEYLEIKLNLLNQIYTSFSNTWDMARWLSDNI